MPFKCACFISYPHNAGKSVDRFVVRLKEELADRLAQYVGEPVESDRDIATGADYNKKIARRLCESACLLVVYVPVYQRKPFCLQEFTAMERIQDRRYQEIQADLSADYGMILPLIYTGNDNQIPPWIKQKNNYFNISQYTLSDPESVFAVAEFKAWVRKQADMIWGLYQEFEKRGGAPCRPCDDWALPSETDPEIAKRLNIPLRPPDSFR